MKDLWGGGPAGAADELDRIVHLCRAVGADPDLVQPGGGNASVKLMLRDRFGVEEDTLLVKGSGLDLHSIDRSGFTALFLSRLSPLRDRDEMGDVEMMEFLRACMRNPHRDPFPSIETPLHSILPFPVILHTHDVATLSLTDLPGEAGRDLVERLFPGEVLYLPYCRPGFTLARAVRERAGRIPTAAVGMVLARHGLVVWGEDARQCHDRLVRIVGRVEEFLEEKRPRADKRPAAAAPPGEADRVERAAALLPVIRGFLGGVGRVVLHRDGSDEILERLSAEGARERSGRGMATPDHILLAGRRPLWIETDFGAPQAKWIEAARVQLEDCRREYLEYHGRNARGGEESIRDWAKVVLVPGLGMITAGRDRAGALAAAACYRAVLRTMDNADPLGGFEFLSEPEVFHFEHWPLERRKMEERGRDGGGAGLLPGGVVLVVGGGSGIGAASSERFAEEGAHVLVADLDEGGAGEVAERITQRFPGRAVAAGVD
ncbi:MAG: SDR family NAD(P)-dependent oxidoreductase, partial [Acidobacteria bacterium]|nr:SDR family NAD(P)-dependent oxidoreductase [Acidobacteriota bacterium]